MIVFRYKKKKLGKNKKIIYSNDEKNSNSVKYIKMQ